MVTPLFSQEFLEQAHVSYYLLRFYVHLFESFLAPFIKKNPARTCTPKLNHPHDASSRRCTLKIQFSFTAQAKRRTVSLHFLHFVSHRNSRDVRMKILLHYFPMNFYVSCIIFIRNRNGYFTYSIFTLNSIMLVESLWLTSVSLLQYFYKIPCGWLFPVFYTLKKLL